MAKRMSLQLGIEPRSPALVGMTSRNTNHYTIEDVVVARHLMKGSKNIQYIM
jgi:hypothetical protein